MYFRNACHLMDMGEKVKLPGWGGYLYKSDSGRILHKEGKIALPVKDFLSDKWEAVRKKTLSDKVEIQKFDMEVVKDKETYFECDVKEAIKELRGWLLFPVQLEQYDKKAKEIFGERLV